MAREGRIVLLHRPGRMEEAARLLASLDKRYSTRIVVDPAAVHEGARVEHALRQLTGNDLMVLVLDPSWESADEEGQIADRRALWLQIACESGAAIIAVRVGAASIPLARYLPADRAGLGAIPEIELNEDTWDAGVTRLLDEIDRAFAKPSPADITRGRPTSTASADEHAGQASPRAATPPQVTHRLRSVSTLAAGAAFDIYDRVTVGRAQDAGIRLDHPDISRHHAILHLEGDRLTLQDTESTNGTWINEERVTSRSPTELSIGDVITFGTREAQLRLE